MREKQYEHQRKEFEEFRSAPARALLWAPRTGKSKAVIDKLCWWAKDGPGLDGALVFAPNGVHENWTRRELPRHHWHGIPHQVLHWSTDAAKTVEWHNRLQHICEAPGLSWLSMAAETMTRDDCRAVIAKFYKARKGLGVVYSESQYFRTPGSDRSYMARALTERSDVRVIETGSVVTNSPLHAWAQFELLKKRALNYRTFTEFKLRYAEYQRITRRDQQTYPKLLGYKHLAELTRAMGPFASVVLRKDVKDLPAVIKVDRFVTPTDEQLRIYRELVRKFRIDVADNLVSIGERAPRLMKMQQVLSGFLVDEYGDLHEVPGMNPRLEALSDEVLLHDGKVVVWCMFQEDIRRVRARMHLDGHRTAELHGCVRDKWGQVELFQNDPGVKVMIGQWASGKGIPLHAANLAIGYSHTFDAIHREQSDERPIAIGGHDVDMLDLVVPNSVDDYIRDNVREKFNLATAIARDGLRKVLEYIDI